MREDDDSQLRTVPEMVAAQAAADPSAVALAAGLEVLTYGELD